MWIAEVSVLAALPDVFAELAPPSQEALVSIRDTTCLAPTPTHDSSILECLQSVSLREDAEAVEQGEESLEERSCGEVGIP